MLLNVVYKQDCAVNCLGVKSREHFDSHGHLDYSERNIVEKLFQTYTMQIERFHETWNGSQTSA